MRTWFVGMLATAGLLAFASPVLAQGTGHRVAYLDSRRILQEAPGAQEVRESMQQEMGRFQTQLKALDDSLQRMVQDYQQKSVMLSPEEKRKREQEIVQTRTQLEQQAGQLEQQAAQKQNELMKPVMERVEKVISDLRQEEGYAIIFDVASAAMVSADTTLDLTNKVIERLKAAPGASPTVSNR